MSSDAAARRIGRNVFLALSLATAAEFSVAIADIPGAFVILLAFALAKAWLIVVYFMHVRQLRGDEH